MYFQERNIAYLNKLKDFIALHYGFNIKSIEPAKRGCMAETYTIDSKEGKFFVKIVSFSAHKKIYKESFQVVDYLNKQPGIDFILKNVRTKKGELSSVFKKNILGVFQFEEGEHTEEYPLEMLFEKYALIYEVKVKKIKIKKEDFKTSSLDLYTEKFSEFKKKTSFREVVDFLNSKNELIKKRKKEFKKIARICEKDFHNFYITHGDGQGNVIFNKKRITIIDWDTPLLAPIERDAWVFLRKKDILKLFNEIMKKNGIDYTLKKERLCYYCYSYFFYYLAEYLEWLENAKGEEAAKKILKEIKSIFLNSNWLNENMVLAEKVCSNC